MPELSREELLSEVNELRQRVAALVAEKADLEMMIEMNTEYSDQLEEDLLKRVESTLRESEKRFRLITETIPVPIIISRIHGSEIVYANEPASDVIGISVEKLLTRKATEFYDPEDRKFLSDKLAEQGYVSNYELKGRTANRDLFWVALFVRPLTFGDEPCMLTVWYDLTERKKAEDEIRRLNEELEERKKQREGKYLIFTLAHEEYGISILKVKEIIGIVPMTSVPNTPDFIRGVINLRGRVIPVTDLRLRFGLEAGDYTDRTCIIVMELGEETDIGKTLIGVIVDTVSEVLNIKAGDIKDPPEFGAGIKAEYLLGMAVIKENVKSLINIEHVFDFKEIALWE